MLYIMYTFVYTTYDTQTETNVINQPTPPTTDGAQIYLNCVT